MGRWSALWRSARLEAQFLIVSALVLGCTGLVLYLAVSRVLTAQAVQAAVVEAGRDNAALSPMFLSLPADQPLAESARTEIDRMLAAQGVRRYALVKVWTPEGKVLYSTDRSLTGQSFDPFQNEGLRSALRGEAQGELTGLEKGENVGDHQLGFTHLLEAYTPLWDESGKVRGAFEIYRDASLLFGQLETLRVVLGSGLLAGLLLTWLALYGFVLRAGRALCREHDSVLMAERRLEATLRGALSALSDAVEAKDAYTGGHIERVAGYSVALAEAVAVPQSERRALEFAAILHDVGKLSVPDAVLLKPGSLTPEERGTIETHAARGQQILARVPGLSDVGVIVRHHHERWDGTGYPDRLASSTIPLGARIIAVADTYDAITTDRPYRRARSHEEALAELSRMAGAQFDPQVVEAFARLPRERLQPGLAVSAPVFALGVTG
jgi:HD-GYP domain-containing protein (c-di-GMP phosphodiesterase class II)